MTEADFQSLAGERLSGVTLVAISTFLVFLGAMKSYQVLKKRQRMNHYLKDFDGPPGKWFIGNAGDLTMDQEMFTKFKSYMAKYGGISKYTMYGDYYLALGDPESIVTVMKTTEPKDKNIYSMLSKWIGNGILTSTGPHWFRNRRLLTPAFHFEVLKPYTEIFSKTSYTLVSKWREVCGGKQTSLEMIQNFSLMTLDSLLQTAFSTETNCQKLGNQHPYINAVFTITEAVCQRINAFVMRNDFIFYNFTVKGYRVKKALQAATNFTKNIIRRKLQEKEGNVQQKKQRKYMDFVDMLLEAKDKDGVGLSEKEILDEVDTFMFAGHDTTASALSWLMYHLANHPEHQERCREEIREVLEGRDSITWADLPKLEYLTMCLKESLRLTGPVPIAGRILTTDIKFPDGRIAPAGTFAWLHMHLVHHNPAVWENPEEYDPQRFSPENSAGRHSHAFVPFSAGPRNCIGQHFALNELKITAAQVLNNFQFDVDEKRLPERKLDIVLRSKNGMWLKVTPL